mmetsp:Transcript_105197/g.182970  ORF Transcript_105197/g.182970 Transcript_105197/m.182970 type:complete len:291 (+) Transcript_105197:273-1145(+)
MLSRTGTASDSGGGGVGASDAAMACWNCRASGGGGVPASDGAMAGANCRAEAALAGCMATDGAIGCKDLDAAPGVHFSVTDAGSGVRHTSPWAMSIVCSCRSLIVLRICGAPTWNGRSLCSWDNVLRSCWTPISASRRVGCSAAAAVAGWAWRWRGALTERRSAFVMSSGVGGTGAGGKSGPTAGSSDGNDACLVRSPKGVWIPPGNGAPSTAGMGTTADGAGVTAADGLRRATACIGIGGDKDRGAMSGESDRAAAPEADLRGPTVTVLALGGERERAPALGERELTPG